MTNWIMDRLFGPLLNMLVTFAPWFWLAACVAGAVATFFLWPLVFKRIWREIIVVAVVGFVVLWVWQHFAGIDKLKAENADLADRLETSETTATNLQTSIDNQAAAITAIEANQRRIRRDITAARQGLDSATITQETQDDPVQAAVDLSDRWNRLGGMFDAETNSFGRATPSAARSSADQPAAGDVGDAASGGTGD